MDRFRSSSQRALSGLCRMAGGLALAAGVTAGAHAAQYVPTAAITLPGGVALTSVDIGYVDTTLGAYYLASRDEKGIVAVNTSTLAATVLNSQFAGVVTSPTSGPNGIITVNHNEVWGGDGNGTVKAVNAATGALIATIGPQIGPFTATARADEGCWDPNNNVAVFAWDEPTDLFIAFISTTTHTVLSAFKFNGTGGAPNATNGIEQCQWDARTNLIYLNIPEVNGPGNDTVNGAVVVLDGSKASLGSGAIVNTWPIPVANCNGPQGMAIGPRREIGLNCSTNGTTKVGNGSVAINDMNGTVVATFPTIWGGDEMYYDAGAAHYVFSNSNHVPAQLAFVATATDTQDQSITTAGSEHSVAADFVHRQIFFPVVNSAAAQAQKLCSSVGGNDALGCILVLTRQ